MIQTMNGRRWCDQAVAGVSRAEEDEQVLAMLDAPWRAGPVAGSSDGGEHGEHGSRDRQAQGVGGAVRITITMPMLGCRSPPVLQMNALMNATGRKEPHHSSHHTVRITKVNRVFGGTKHVS